MKVVQSHLIGKDQFMGTVQIRDCPNCGKTGGLKIWIDNQDKIYKIYYHCSYKPKRFFTIGKICLGIILVCIIGFSGIYLVS